MLAMNGLVFILLVALTVGLVVGLGKDKETSRTFSIDHEANTFLMDGKPFRFVSGSFQYFRAFPQAWRNRLRTMRAGGLNVLDTYVEWSLHNPHDGEYVWDGLADVVKFLELTKEEGLYVILRPSPYICAERDNGGLPHWLLTKFPNMLPRSSDANYLDEVRKWYAVLLPRIQHLLYGNGGNIIMVQVENEYSSYGCDHVYLNWLRDETEKYVQQKALLFTMDIPNPEMHCGKIDNVFATTDFGIDRIHEIESIWQTLRTVQPTGPLVVIEFYPGWFSHWQGPHQKRDAQKVADALRVILSYNASVNMLMYFGGTNFGFTAGGDGGSDIGYRSLITSYQFDAVLDEAGGLTPKFELLRSVIGEVLELPDIKPDPPVKRLSYGTVQLTPVLELFSAAGRAALSTGPAVRSQRPQSFEQMDQFSGLLLYETKLPHLELDPTVLRVNNLRDRAHVFIDQKLVGTLSREGDIYALPLSKGWGSTLQILVENLGRLDYRLANDTKGIFGEITLKLRNYTEQPLTEWRTTGYPLEELKEQQVSSVQPLAAAISRQQLLRSGPIVYSGSFQVSEVGDTYLNVEGWGKGVAYVNGFNLGRYWPLAGPQITLYVPNQLLRLGENSLHLIEYQRANKTENGEELPVARFDAVANLG